MRYCLIFWLVMLIFRPQMAFSIGGAWVVGCAESTGALATPMGVSNAATDVEISLEDTIMQVGRSLKGEQEKIIASINKNFEIQNDFFREIMLALGHTREKMIHLRMFGPQSKAYGIGIAEKRFNNVRKGMGAEKRLSENFRLLMSGHIREFRKHEDRKGFYMIKDLDSISPDFFFPPNSVMMDEQMNMADFTIRAVLDPFPTPKLPDQLSARGKAMGYQAKRKVKYSRLAIPIAVISDIVSSYIPTMELGDWAKEMYRKMGGSGVPPQVVDGKISSMGYIDMMINARFANQEWFSGEKGIHGRTRTGVLRELAVMESVSLEMQLRQMKYMQQIAGLLAQDQAMKTGERFNGPLNSIYEKVVK